MNIIHRGIANKKLKENCFKSFKESFNKKHGIETDIHFTKDNKIICFHDFTLNRLFKINKSVKNLHYDDAMFKSALRALGNISLVYVVFNHTY